MSDKFHAAYRCDLCGEIFFGNSSVDSANADDFCMDLMHRIQIGKYFFWSEPIYTKHNCADGSIGIARLVGAKKMQGDKE